jgi:hypothetical protein
MAERTVDALVVRWYERRDRSPDVVERWLRAAREELPEAVPRRFGDSEPLRGRFDGGDALADAYGRADSLLFLAGAPPIYHASLAATGSGKRGPTAVHSLQAVLDPADPRVRRFALALTHPGTVYVSASVERGLVLDRGTLYGPAVQPGEPYLAPHGDWLGLPPEPPLWCWFGPVYRRRAARDVSGQERAGGLLYTGGPWVRPPLRAQPEEVDPVRRRAARVPRGLRRSALWMPSRSARQLNG